MPFGAALAFGATVYSADRQNDAAKDAARSQRNQNAQERDFILQQTNQARDGVNRIYDTQAQNTMMGGRSAFDILSGAIPQQAGLFNQGQNNAMSAILGGQITPFAQPDFGFLPQTLPQYRSFQQVAPSNSTPMGPDVAAQAAQGIAAKNLGKWSNLRGGR